MLFARLDTIRPDDVSVWPNRLSTTPRATRTQCCSQPVPAGLCSFTRPSPEQKNQDVRQTKDGPLSQPSLHALNVAEKESTSLALVAWCCLMSAGIRATTTRSRIHSQRPVLLFVLFGLKLLAWRSIAGDVPTTSIRSKESSLRVSVCSMFSRIEPQCMCEGCELHCFVLTAHLCAQPHRCRDDGKQDLRTASEWR